MSAKGGIGSRGRSPRARLGRCATALSRRMVRRRHVVARSRRLRNCRLRRQLRGTRGIPARRRGRIQPRRRIRRRRCRIIRRNSSSRRSRWRFESSIRCTRRHWSSRHRILRLIRNRIKAMPRIAGRICGRSKIVATRSRRNGRRLTRRTHRIRIVGSTFYSGVELDSARRMGGQGSVIN